ncbi:MAG: radical SAM protein [Calditrichaeota bacterium]|nr:radical SAM protein [Calditrichota bacterium]
MHSMNKTTDIQIDDRWILTRRSAKNPVNPWRPYTYLVEKERTKDGVAENVATIFLTNRECPFHCLMCDLWKNTTDCRVPDGAIPAQIQWALDRLSPAPNLKLYNSGSFFDAQAIPPTDFQQIAKLLDPFRTVIVESHPRLVNDRCLAFRDSLKSRLHVALGLETVHSDVLRKLNKRMTLKDFERATNYLIQNKILVRAFILLRPPFLTEAEGVIWAKRSIDFAFNIGVECCVVIPTRGGNGALERLREQGLFHSPTIQSLEEVLEYGIQLNYGRVFADLWDMEKFSHCKICSSQRIQRLRHMNMTQVKAAPIQCPCDKKSAKSIGLDIKQEVYLR